MATSSYSRYESGWQACGVAICGDAISNGGDDMAIFVWPMKRMADEPPKRNEAAAARRAYSALGGHLFHAREYGASRPIKALVANGESQKPALRRWAKPTAGLRKLVAQCVAVARMARPRGWLIASVS